MSRVLIGIAVVTAGLALTISMSVNAAATQTQSGVELHAIGVNSGSQRSGGRLEMNDGRLPESSRFPLMLPQPTKVDEQNKYNLG